MVSIYQIKPKFQALLRPLTNRLASLGVTANQVTIFAAILSIVTGALIYFYGEQSWPLLLVPVILLVRMALNAIDGMLAREHSYGGGDVSQTACNRVVCSYSSSSNKATT